MLKLKLPAGSYLGEWGPPPPPPPGAKGSVVILFSTTIVWTPLLNWWPAGLWITSLFHWWMCLVFVLGLCPLCFVFRLFRVMSMSRDQRFCPGAGGRRFGAFMSPIFRDPHPTYARCMGIKCTADVTCDICKDWSVVQWESFLKRRRKKRPSGSTLPPPPSTSPSSEAERPELPPQPLPPPSEGCGRSGEAEGVLRVGSREVSPPPSFHSL